MRPEGILPITPTPRERLPLHGHHPADVEEHRARAPWYLSKTNPSFADMLAKLRRTIIADQYSPGRLRDPYRQKINAIQQAWAALLP